MMAAEGEALVSKQRLRARVVECGPLELEEDQRGLDLRATFLHALQQRPALRVGSGGREAQHRVGAGAPDQLLQRGQLGHRHREPRSVELGDLVGVRARERVGTALRLVQQRLDAGGARAGRGQQRLQVPGDTLDLGIGDLICGHGRRDYDARSPSSISVR